MNVSVNISPLSFINKFFISVDLFSSHFNFFASPVSKMRTIFVGDCKKRQISRHELSASQERVTRENVSCVSV